MHAFTDRLACVAWPAILCLGLMLTLSGCKAFNSPFDRPPHWKVELSSLDSVAFKWTPSSVIHTESPRTVIIELMGNGYMTIASGVGGKVNDPFQDAIDGQAPADERRDQMTLSESDTKRFYQRVVDAGFFEKKFDLSKEAQNGGDSLLIFAKINSRKHIQSTDAPEMMALYRILLDAF
ncbi:MAG: hypothetical protein ACI9OU_002293 [Candidatus Promineifilaceae bacterium]|jgi:hypothetical protein